MSVSSVDRGLWMWLFGICEEWMVLLWTWVCGCSCLGLQGVYGVIVDMGHVDVAIRKSEVLMLRLLLWAVWT